MEQMSEAEQVKAWVDGIADGENLPVPVESDTVEPSIGVSPAQVSKTDSPLEQPGGKVPAKRGPDGKFAAEDTETTKASVHDQWKERVSRREENEKLKAENEALQRQLQGQANLEQALTQLAQRDVTAPAAPSVPREPDPQREPKAWLVHQIRHGAAEAVGPLVERLAALERRETEHTEEQRFLSWEQQQKMGFVREIAQLTDDYVNTVEGEGFRERYDAFQGKMVVPGGHAARPASYPLHRPVDRLRRRRSGAPGRRSRQDAAYAGGAEYRSDE
jgi:hypothetical protein